MRAMLAAAVLGGILGAAGGVWAEGVVVAQWRLDADADGDGVADGWTVRRAADGAACSVVADVDGTVVQQVTGARSGDSLTRPLTGLDAHAAYLVTARVAVAAGGVLWGPEGMAQKYLAAYSRPVEARLTLTGRDAVTLAFTADALGTSFSVESVVVERVERSPLPVEVDTGRSLVPRPRRIEYQPGETEGCILDHTTPVALVGLEPAEVGLNLFAEDLGLDGPRLVGLGDLPREGGPALAIGSLDALRAQRQTLPPALTEAVDACSALPDEGYRLTVGQEGVVLIAAIGAAAHHCLQKLRKLCAHAGDGRWRAPKLAIDDWPAMPFRATYQLGATATPERLAMARYYARLKLNAVAMEDGVFYHLHEGDNLARVREYFDTLRALHVEPIPLVQSFGWGMYVLGIDPQCVEAHYVEALPMRFATRDQLPPEAREAIPDDGREHLVPDQLLIPLATPLANGSFEQVEGDRPSDWQADRWAVEDGAAVGADGPDPGARCLALTRQTRGTMRVWQDFEVPERSNLQISLRLRLKGVAGAGAYAEIYRVTPEHELVGNPVAMSTWLTGDRDWETCRLDLDTVDHRWYRIYLRIQDAVGSVWFDDVQARRAGGGLRNLVHVAESLKLTDEAGAPFVAGQDYEVVSGDTRFPFTADARPWELVRLPGGRIPPEGVVRLSYEYAPTGAVTYCPSDPRTQAIMRDTLGTVVRELGAKHVHIGHDEPRWINTCRRCQERGLTNAELFADEITRMREFVAEADPQARMMMWADALNPYHNAPAQELEPANDSTPKDIIQCVWFYQAGDDIAEARSLAYFARRGYETTGSPWFDLENNWDWARECHLSRQANGKCLGMLYTSWSDNPNVDPWAGLSLAAAFSWNPDDPQALEALPWSPVEMNRTHGLLP